MKILQLRFKNLNSLSGEWSIDFTVPGYVSEGIFAITGPTGSGKTTILDAICLALYGRTPRLAKITKTSNELISRQTGECFAEVVFETQVGRFRCHWSQRRARKKFDGELQAPQHEIADELTGKILESKLREVANAIEERTGMDFDRFTRSMLLAQGGFAAFLQAVPDERAPILEQITGTGIYSSISQRVHERHREEGEKLKLLQAEIFGIRLLDAEEEQEIRIEFGNKQQTEQELTQQHEGVQKNIIRLEGMASLQRELTVIDEETLRLEASMSEFEPDRSRLQRALLAAELDGEYATLDSQRKAQNSDSIALTNSIAQLPDKEMAATKAETTLKNAESDLAVAAETRKKEQETLKRVRSFDLRIEEKEKDQQHSVEELRKQEQQIEDLVGQQSRTKKETAFANTELAAVEAFLSEHNVDATLVTELTGIRHMLENLRGTWEKKQALAHSLDQCRKELEIAKRSHSEREVDFKMLEKQLAAVRNSNRQKSASLSNKLEKREMRQWRDELDSLKERSLTLDRSGALVIAIQDNEKKKVTLEASLHKFTQNKIAQQIELENLSAQSAGLESEIGHLETQAALENRIKSLEAERKKLEDGKPCPLCGSEHHPFAEGNLPDIDDTQKTLSKAKNRAKEIAARSSEAQIQMAKLEKDIEQLGQQYQEILIRIEEDSYQYSELLAILGWKNTETVTEMISIESATAKEKSARIAQIIRDGERLALELQTVQKQEQALYESFLQAEREFRQAEHTKSVAKSNLEKMEQECGAALVHYEALKNLVAEKIRVYGIEQLSEGEWENISNTLETRAKAWQQKQQQQSKIERQLTELKAKEEHYQIRLETIREEAKGKRVRSEALREVQAALIAERRELYGEKIPDVEEQRLDVEVTCAEASVKANRELRDKVKQNLRDSTMQIASLQEAIAKRSIEIAEAEHAFEQHCKKLGFAQEADFAGARLPKAEREELKQREDTLQKKRTELETRKKDRSDKLKAETEKNITNASVEELRQQQDKFAAALRTIGQEIGALKQKLSDNETARRLQRDKVQAIEAQKKECERWDALQALIGSADGKKYRNFAQGLTFELMVSYANQQLKKMTDRYLVIRDKIQPLELNVIDAYQAGEIRSTKNLSGGESFIVSLALALGLSKMASRKVRVDSLFLDEGFGTLDEEALETALETLSGLQQDGKLIGIISHIPALKERIRTQIEIIPLSGGKSKIAGPGCQRAAAVS